MSTLLALRLRLMPRISEHLFHNITLLPGLPKYPQVKLSHANTMLQEVGMIPMSQSLSMRSYTHELQKVSI